MDTKRVFKSDADSFEGGYVAGSLDPCESVACIRGEQPGEVFRLNERGSVREGAGQVLSKRRADLAGERAGILQHGRERLLGVGHAKGLQLGGVSLRVLAQQDEIAGVGDEDEAVSVPVAADLIAFGGEPGVVVRGLDLDHAALGELSLARLSALYLPGGVESEVGVSGALFGELAYAEDLGLQGCADGVQEVGERAVSGAFAGGSA